MRRNIALRLQYDGTAYHGWQVQKTDVTVAETLERALTKVCGEPIKVVGCGRTDAGVHAKRYCANFRTDCTIPIDRVPLAVNARLPADIAVVDAVAAPEDFNAIGSCIQKEYVYQIYNSRIRDAFLEHRVCFYPQPLDFARLARAGRAFEGTHDFAAVRSVGTETRTTVRTVHWCRAERDGPLISIAVCADGFLYNMVRAIVGTMVYASYGKIEPEAIPALLATRDHPKHNLRLRQTVIVAVCVLAVLLFLYLLLRDRPGSASDYLDDSAPYTFDSSASRTFRTVDSRLAVVSSSGLQLLDENGKTVLHEIFTLSQPGISVGGERVCAYDIGGTTLCVADFKGNKTDIEPAGEIISADLSDSGYLAVCSDAAGYKGAVTVYDTSGKAVYVWYSGTGYLVRAAVSPDGKYLAALCLQDSGSVVHTFALTSEDERGSAACADELFADLFWRGGKVCCVSQTRLAFFDDNAKLTAEYPFGDLYLYDYAAEGDGFVTLALSRYRSGSAEQLVMVNASGSELGKCETTGAVTSLSVNGKQVLVQYSDRLTLYNQQLDEIKSVEQNLLGVRRSVLLRRGAALLLSGSSAEVLAF